MVEAQALAGQQPVGLVTEATPTDAVQPEVDGGVDDDAQLAHRERLVDDVLVELRHTTHNAEKRHC